MSNGLAKSMVYTYTTAILSQKYMGEKIEVEKPFVV